MYKSVQAMEAMMSDETLQTSSLRPHQGHGPVLLYIPPPMGLDKPSHFAFRCALQQLAPQQPDAEAGPYVMEWRDGHLWSRAPLLTFSTRDAADSFLLRAKDDAVLKHFSFRISTKRADGTYEPILTQA